MNQLIPLALSIITLWTMWLAGNKDWRAWVLGAANQILWFIFILTFSAWGLLPLNVALTIVYIRNLVSWRNNER